MSRDATPRRERIAVRQLVRAVHRTGDLAADPWDAVPGWEAVRLHRRVQRSRPFGYQAEVVVRDEVVADELVLLVEGRLDGLWEEGGAVVVEEIKTTRRALDELAGGGNPLHWAQALVYSCLVQRTRPGQPVETQLTYIHADSLEQRIFRRSLSSAELETFYCELVEALIVQIRELDEWRRLRNASARELEFPLPEYRPGQYRAAGEVYRALRDQVPLLFQAPTGIGKTLAVLFPAAKAMGEGHLDRTFFVTARTTAQQAALDAAATLAEAGLRWRVVQLTAREKLCPDPEGECSASSCPLAKGYYDRLAPALAELKAAERTDRARLLQAAEKHSLCPFALSLDFARWADLVIGDYNYAFDPRLLVKEEFLGAGERVAYLVDEAHNLVDRGRDMFSAELGGQTVRETLAHLERLETNRNRGRGERRLRRMLRRLEEWFAAQRENLPGGAATEVVLRDAPAELFRSLYPYRKLLGSLLSQAAEWPVEIRKSVRELQDAIERVLWVATLYRDDFVTLAEPDGTALRLKLRCLDPARLLGAQLRQATALVLFSATLTPLPYFQAALGLPEKVRRLVLPNPFPAENLRVVAVDGVSTLFRRRAETAGRLVECLRTFVRARRGNYLIFFPSYEYLQMVLPTLRRSLPGVRLLVQDPGMSEADRERFLAEFHREDRRRTTLVGLAVMGGIFGEGIDLMGERLSGAAVVGVGLPGICVERELMRTYYERKYGSGFDYAYVFPGMNRVLQAAGRVIRSEKDRGVILLIDPRFLRSPYRGLLPREWRVRRAWDRAALERLLEEFWSGETCRSAS
ncbi:MAG: ATP-dependent DNA helicase [Acidobacteriota bacterium]